MEIIDLVRKSSGVIMGAVMFEIDFAADLNARKDAVKFDLKADFWRSVGKFPSFWLSLFPSPNTRKSISHASSSGSDKG
jgi:hypothetical protein